MTLPAPSAAIGMLRRSAPSMDGLPPLATDALPVPLENNPQPMPARASIAKKPTRRRNRGMVTEATADSHARLADRAVAMERAIIHRSPGAWFELHGAIYDKERNIHRAPDLELNTMQQKLDEIVVWCEENGVPCRIITLKGRQQGSSTWSVGGLYHKLRKKRTKACIIGDLYERSVANLVSMFDLYAQEDRHDWGNDYYAPGQRFSNGSELKTETANSPRAGASGTFQSVLATEVAHWKETNGKGGKKISAKAVFAALLNCVPKKAGTLVIVESTPNGASGVYYDTYQGAATFEQVKNGETPANWNGFIKVFYPWHEHPEYCNEVTTAQSEDIMGSLSEREEELISEHRLGPDRLSWRREKLAGAEFNFDESKFEEEYPADEERCFLMSGRRAFPLIPLQQMKRKAELEGPGKLKMGVLQWTDSRENRSVYRLTDEDEAWVKIWESPKPGCRYLFSGDPMTGQVHGNDPDNHGLGMWRDGYWGTDGRWNPPTQVARLTDVFAEKREVKKRAACRWDIATTEARIALLAAYYGWAKISVEINMDRGLIELLKLRPMADLFVRVHTNRLTEVEANEYGWYTSPKTRGPIIEALKTRIRKWDEPGVGMMIWDPVVIGEMMTMVVLENGREEAAGSCHDDQVLQAAIANACMDAAKVMPFPQMQGMGYEPQRDMTYS